MKKLLLSFLTVLSLSSYAQLQQDPPRPVTECNSMVPYGSPTSRILDKSLVCRKGYFLEHDNIAKIPSWVSYVLTPDETIGCHERGNAFMPDYSIKPGSRAELKDYSKSGYDIGHQANSADMSWDKTVERESFILSNMAPQLPGFNRGIWKKLEDQSRAWALTRGNPLLIYVGPIYNDEDKKIGKNGVIVPHGFYKIIVDTVTKESLVFSFKHEAAQGSLNLFIAPLARVQQGTNITFPMPKEVKYSDRIWPSATKSVRAAKRDACSVK